MFRKLINDAKSAAGSVIAKYLARASVAVPFFIAVGFVTAAVTVMLVERFGAVTAYWTVAGGFTLMGVVAALAVSIREHEEEVADKEAERGDTAAVTADAAAQAMLQAPIALLGALFTTPFGPTAAAGGTKWLYRNLPLVVLLTLIGMLLWPSEPVREPSEEADLPRGRPNGAEPPDPEAWQRDVA